MQDRERCAAKRHEGGFSILEMMVTVSIAALVTGIAVPFASDLAKEYQLVGAATQLSADLSRSRVQAVGQSVFMRVRFTDGQHYVRERSTDNGATYAQDGATVALPSGINATSTATSTFNRNGLATQASTITISNGRATKDVHINLIGRVIVS